MLNIVIVDDEDLAVERMVCILEDFNDDLKISGFTDYKKALNYIINNNVDIAFLDIEMPEVTGIQLAEQFIDIIPSIEIVFVTAHNHYALEAFKTYAIGYLLKPVDDADVRKQINHIYRKKQEKEKPNIAQKIKVLSFGQFICIYGDEITEPIRWRTSKAEELIAFLIYHKGYQVERDVIIEALWAEMDLEQAVKNFHATCYYIRNALKRYQMGQLIVRLQGRYAINMEIIDSDYIKFIELVNQTKIEKSNIELFEKASNLYKGQFMEGRDYEWLVNERSIVENEWMLLNINLVKAYGEKNRFDDAIVKLKRMVYVSPFNEEIHEMIINYFLAKGDIKKASEHYEKYSELFLAEFGEVPELHIKGKVEKLFVKKSL